MSKWIKANALAKWPRAFGWEWTFTVEVATKKCILTELRPGADRTPKGAPSYKTVRLKVDGKSEEYAGRHEFKVVDAMPRRVV